MPLSTKLKQLVNVTFATGVIAVSSAAFLTLDRAPEKTATVSTKTTASVQPAASQPAQ